MKRSVVLLSAIICIQVLVAQSSEVSGVIVYEDIRKMDIQLQGETSHLSGLIPKERKSHKELWFNTEASLYRNLAKNNDEEVLQESSGGATIMIKMQEPELNIHTNLQSMICTEQREFMSRNFLIENRLDTLKWQLTGNQKEILGYSCYEASLQNDPGKIKVWFTHEIPVSTGPDGLGGLPGVILALESDDGNRVITAKEYRKQAIAPKQLMKPREGKKMSREAFEKVVSEKRKEMESSGEGVFIIKRN